MTLPSLEFKTDLLAAIPSLRAFAISLAGRDQADDLVQETMIKAWKNSDKFSNSTNIRAWLFTILRNHFYSVCRRTKKEIQDTDGIHANSVTSMPSQEHAVELSKVMLAIEKLSFNQREAIVLIAMHNMAYEEVSEIMKCSIGTIKSRVHRARNNLLQILSAPLAKRNRSAIEENYLRPS